MSELVYPSSAMLRGLAIAVLVSCVSARALAQDVLGAARARIAAGEAAETLAELERVEREGALTRDDLIALYELRVIAAHALDAETTVDRTLRAIAEVAPDHELSDEVAPVLHQRFAVFVRASGGPPRIDARVASEDRGVTIGASAIGDEESLVRAVRVRARVAGGPWVEGERSVEVAAGAGARVEWEASAIGPGGAVLATARGEHALPSAGGDAWPWVIAGGGALVVAAVVVIAVVAASGVDTRVEGPVIVDLRF